MYKGKYEIAQEMAAKVKQELFHCSVLEPIFGEWVVRPIGCRNLYSEESKRFEEFNEAFKYLEELNKDV